MNFNQNLEMLRLKLQELDVDAILVAINNFFGNFEDEISGIRYISGFSGSNGRAIVSKDKAILSVDGRYVRQALEQTDNKIWQICEYPEFNTNAIVSKIFTTPGHTTLAVGPFSMTYKSYLLLLKLSSEIGFKVKMMDSFPVGFPDTSRSSIYLTSEKNTGESRKSRIKRVQDTLKSDDEAILLTEKSLIGWTFGVRVAPTQDKSIIPNCVALLKKDQKPIVFSDIKLSESTDDFIFEDLSGFEKVTRDLGVSTVYLDYSTTSLYFPEILKENGYTIKHPTLDYGMFEFVKNQTEIRNMRIAVERASLAFIKTLAHIESAQTSSEIEVAQFFEDNLKSDYQDSFVDLSYNPISAFGKNTSIVHYNPKTCGNSPIEGDGLFLFDAGAHFKDATTDMTRTIYRGLIPPMDLKIIYSSVLEALITFCSQKFPDKTKACYLDSIARSAIWNRGFDYHFGSGHGVGSFGNVHEHPRVSPNSVEEITKDMIITIEPGIYTDDLGVRLENMVLTKNSNIHSGFVEFETLSYIPFCRKLIVRDLFKSSEIAWLNEYHKLVYEKFAPSLQNDELTLNWLKENTEEL